MAFPLPRSLSPSALAGFTGCGLHFRFSSIDRLPERPTIPAIRGTLVHAALEHLFTLEPATRVPDVGAACVDAALAQVSAGDEWLGLGLDAPGAAVLRAEAIDLVAAYFTLEDPRQIHPIGIECKLEATIGGITVRGIIDRLDLVDGELIITDYKTGRAPGPAGARSSMTGVQIYALLCERFFGRRPARVRLLHLAEPTIIVTEPTAQSIAGIQRRLEAAWAGIEAVCEAEDFRPRTSHRCSWCSFHDFCPAVGGDLAAAALAGRDHDAAQLHLIPA